MVCLRWRPYLLAAVAAAATERVSGPALGVVLYSGNGSSAAVKVAAALTVQYFPPHAEVRHYLCTDARSAAAVRDSLGNGTVLTTFPEDDGAAGLSARRRVEVACEVRYDISAADVLYLQRLAAEDGERILEKLKGPNYDLSTTGIISVIPQAATFAPVDLGDVAFMLSVPFTLLYLEA